MLPARLFTALLVPDSSASCSNYVSRKVIIRGSQGSRIECSIPGSNYFVHTEFSPFFLLIMLSSRVTAYQEVMFGKCFVIVCHGSLSACLGNFLNVQDLTVCFVVDTDIF